MVPLIFQPLIIAINHGWLMIRWGLTVTNPRKLGNDHDQPGNPIMDSQLRFLGFFQRRENFHGFLSCWFPLGHGASPSFRPFYQDFPSFFFGSHFRKPTVFVEYWVYMGLPRLEWSIEFGGNGGADRASPRCNLLLVTFMDVWWFL